MLASFLMSRDAVLNNFRLWSSLSWVIWRLGHPRCRQFVDSRSPPCWNGLCPLSFPSRPVDHTPALAFRGQFSLPSSCCRAWRLPGLAVQDHPSYVVERWLLPATMVNRCTHQPSELTTCITVAHSRLPGWVIFALTAVSKFKNV
jgi:hypothetical protein